MNKIYIKNKQYNTVFEYTPEKIIYTPNPLLYKEILCHRPHILGNPYTSKPSKLAKYKVNTTKEAIDSFASLYFPTILSHIKNIENIYKIYNICLVCWCVPRPCHTFIIARHLRDVQQQPNII